MNPLRFLLHACNKHNPQTYDLPLLSPGRPAPRLVGESRFRFNLRVYLYYYITYCRCCRTVRRTGCDNVRFRSENNAPCKWTATTVYTWGTYTYIIILHSKRVRKKNPDGCICSFRVISPIHFYRFSVHTTIRYEESTSKTTRIVILRFWEKRSFKFENSSKTIN